MKTLVVGAAIIDIIMQVERIPKSGEDVIGKNTKVMVGGCAYNVASTLKNLECEHDLCVPVGSGMHAEIIRAKLKNNGYPILIQDEQEDNGFSMCLVEKDGERTFITVQGIEGEFRQNWFEKLDMNEYQNVYIAGYQVCGENGNVISKWLTGLKEKDIYFAPGPVICEIEKEVMQQILSVHTILHLNEKELFDFTKKDSLEQALEALHDMNENRIIVTLGSEGAVYYDGNEIVKVPTVKAQVVDTIGAGDSHIGAVIGGISKGMSIEESIKMANKVAAGIVGVRGAVMTKEEFDKNVEGYYE